MSSDAAVRFRALLDYAFRRQMAALRTAAKVDQRR
jgi:hypothetical protein